MGSQLGFSPAQSEWILDVDLAATTAARFGLELSNAAGERYRIGYDTQAKQYFSDRGQSGAVAFSKQFAAGLHTAPRTVEGTKLDMHLFFDLSSAELFADEGATAMTELFFPSEPFSQVKFFAEGGSVNIIKAEAHRLKSIWK